MLNEIPLLGGRDLVQITLLRLREFEPPEGYHLAFSGGKDSIVLYDLAVRSGVKFDAHYNVTTVDPPELVRFIRQAYPDVAWDRPEMSMFRLIERQGFPTRKARHCCRVLKEGGGEGRLVLTGIRAAESPNRSKRRMVENCLKGKWKRFLHAIIDWETDEVWRYIRRRKMKYCSLYDEGWKRLGCVGCPMSRNADREFARWPGIEKAYRRAFRKRWELRENLHKQWPSGDAMFEWWVQRDASAPKVVEGQGLFAFGNE